LLDNKLWKESVVRAVELAQKAEGMRVQFEDTGTPTEEAVQAANKEALTALAAVQYSSTQKQLVAMVRIFGLKGVAAPDTAASKPTAAVASVAGEPTEATSVPPTIGELADGSTVPAPATVVLADGSTVLAEGENKILKTSFYKSSFACDKDRQLFRDLNVYLARLADNLRVPTRAENAWKKAYPGGSTLQTTFDHVFETAFIMAMIIFATDNECQLKLVDESTVQKILERYHEEVDRCNEVGEDPPSTNVSERLCTFLAAYNLGFGRKGNIFHGGKACFKYAMSLRRLGIAGRFKSLKGKMTNINGIWSLTLFYDPKNDKRSDGKPVLRGDVHLRESVYYHHVFVLDALYDFDLDFQTVGPKLWITQGELDVLRNGTHKRFWEEEEAEESGNA